MDTDPFQSRRSFIKCFATALIAVGVAGTGRAATELTLAASEPASSTISMDDDAGFISGDDMSDPGWSY